MKRNWASELRAIADGRLMLNVRNGVTVSRSMLAMIADEIDALRAAPLTPSEAGGLVERLNELVAAKGIWGPEEKLMADAAAALEAQAAELSSLRMIADSQVVSHRDFNTVRAEKYEASLASERAAHAETKRELEAAIERENAAREFIKKHPSLTIIDISEFEAFLNLPEAFDRAARRVREGGKADG